jgi:parallel beta-helix repeat protein
MRFRLVLLALGLVLALGSAGASAAGTELLDNGTFDTSVAGWRSDFGDLTRTTIAHSGAGAARVVLRRGRADVFSLISSPGPATIAGTLYAGTAWVRSDQPGERVCLVLRELGGAGVGSVESCLTATSAWQSFPTVSYTALGTGGELQFAVEQRRGHKGDSFVVDDASLTAPFVADVTPPQTTISSGPAASTSATEATFAFGSSEPGSTFACALDGGFPAACTSPATYTGLTEGTHAFSVAATDTAGNADATPATWSWTIGAAPPPPPAPLCTRYAAIDGNDANAGTDAAPFRTAQKLVSTLAAGDTGCLKAGTYAEDVTVSTGGAPGLPITLRSATATQATIKGRLYVRDSANDVVVTELVLNGNGSSVRPSPVVNGDRVRFSAVDVSNDHTDICFIIGSSLGYGIAYDVVVENSRIHDCGALPSTNKDHGIYVEAARNTKIVGNWIYDNADRGVQLYPDSQGTLVANNVIDGNGEGIIFSGDSGWASSNNTVVDNVITNANIRYNVESYWPSGNPIGTSNIAQLNCVWNGKQGNFDGGAGYTQVSNLIVDPLYVNRAAKDFRLAAGSPCAGKGPQN